MRNRFFFIILATLISSAVGINFVHVKFFKSQRLKLIDKQIWESSSALLDSKEFGAAVKNPTTIEDTISKVLKGARIGKVFILRDRNAKIIYQSFNAGLLEAEIPISPEWIAVETSEEYVRVRNIILPGSDHRILQVGLVLDRNFLNWEIIDDRVVNYVVGIVLSLFSASVLLTLVLLAPLRQLISHLQETTSNLITMRTVRPLPKRLIKYRDSFWARSDEFASLLTAIQKLMDRINLNYKLTRQWTLQMAHELKTPLAIMHADTQAEQATGKVPAPFSTRIIEEVQHMSDIISQFLDWAELENSQLQENLFAVRMSTEIKTTLARLSKIAPGRIELDLQKDFSLITNPSHLEQLLSNLITNSLKYSPPESKVNIVVGNHLLTVADSGPGLPLQVRERLGEPFNVGPHDKNKLTGNGLGLAWVSTIAKLYDWKFEINSDSKGTTAVVRFPNEDAD